MENPRDSIITAKHLTNKRFGNFTACSTACQRSFGAAHDLTVLLGVPLYSNDE